MRDFDKIKEQEKGDEFKGMLAIGMIFLIALGIIVYILINLTNQYFDLKTKLEDSSDTVQVVTTDPTEGESFEYKLDKSDVKVEKIRKEIESTSKLDFSNDNGSNKGVMADNGSAVETVMAKNDAVKKQPKSPEKKQVKKEVVKKKETSAPKKLAVKETVKVPKKAEKVSKAPSAPKKKYRYVIQLMAFKNKKDADAKFEKIKNTFDGLHIVKVDLGKKGTWYRLRCYGFENYSEAKMKVEEISKKYKYRPIVVRSKK